jgi:transcriptional regulator with XRE-family HTH domain
MDHAKLGSQMRAVRIRRRLRQADVASMSGVSRATVARLENGQLRAVTLGTLMRVLDALGMVCRITLQWHGGDLDRMVNSRHAGLHESVARWFADQPGWTIAPEVSFSIFGERGVIDILAWHARSRSLLVIELKTEIVDVNELMGSVDRKRRLAIRIARERGWNPVAVGCWVIVADGRTNRRRVARHRTTLRAAFPHDGRTLRAWVAAPLDRVSGLSMWTDAHGQSTTRGLATVRRVRAGARSRDQA